MSVKIYQEGPRRSKKDPVRLRKLRQTSQAAFAASSFSSWFYLIQIIHAIYTIPIPLYNFTMAGPKTKVKAMKPEESNNNKAAASDRSKTNAKTDIKDQIPSRSTEKGHENGPRKKMSRSARAGLQFPVGRIHRHLKERSAGRMQVSHFNEYEPRQSFNFFIDGRLRLPYNVGWRHCGRVRGWHPGVPGRGGARAGRQREPGPRA